MSRAAIRSYAMKIRKLLGYSNKDFIHAPKLFDALSILFASQGLDFDYRVMPDDDEIFCDKEEAYTDVTTGIIYIKEEFIRLDSLQIHSWYPADSC